MLLNPPLGSRTVVPPISTIGAIAPMEAMWNSGDAHRFTSSSANSRQTRMSVSDWHMRFWWVSTAPLGRPVVPEVYMIRAGLSSGTSTAGGSTGPEAAGKYGSAPSA